MINNVYPQTFEANVAGSLLYAISDGLMFLAFSIYYYLLFNFCSFYCNDKPKSLNENISSSSASIESYDMPLCLSTFKLLINYLSEADNYIYYFK